MLKEREREYENVNKEKEDEIGREQLESISPTFYEHNCANFLAQIKSFTFTSSTKKLHAKLSYEKAA
jgi:hypothetical protein